MKKLIIRKFTGAVLLVLIISLLGGTVFFFNKSNKLESDLAFRNQDSSNKIEAYETLFRNFYDADSILLQGKYQEALNMLDKLSESQNLTEIQKNAIRAHFDVLIERKKRQDSIQQISEKLAISGIESSGQLETMQDSLSSLAAALEKEKANFSRLQTEFAKRVKDYETHLNNIDEQQYISFTSSKGSRLYYLGETKSGKAHGEGVGIWLSGSKYEGQWRENKRHGQGEFKWPDGSRYLGDFRDDNRHGKGTYYWNSGEKFVGEWKNDKRNGGGVVYDKDDKIITEGTWKNDNLLDDGSE